MTQQKGSWQGWNIAPSLCGLHCSSQPGPSQIPVGLQASCHSFHFTEEKSEALRAAQKGKLTRATLSCCGSWRVPFSPGKYGWLTLDMALNDLGLGARN